MKQDLCSVMIMIDAVVHHIQEYKLLLASTLSVHAKAVSDKAVVRALGGPKRS